MADHPHNAVVTGASRGIGAAIASRLTAEGWRVTNLDIIEPVTETGASWIRTDLSDADSIMEAFTQILPDGPVTGLVNNAGIPNNETLQQTTLDQFDRTVAINMRAPMICAQAVAEGMKAAGFGRIVNMSSRAHLGKAKRTAYAGTKGAMVSMTGVWALEMAEHGITVNAVAPGPIRTALFDAANPPDDPRTKEIIDQVPVGRLGEPEDIANAVSFFMNDQSGFVTGQTLYVCGGVTLARAGN